jgi:uncharacterized membrane protein
MSLIAVLLVLTSALLHATWNLFSKDTPDKWGFFVAQGMCGLAFYALPAVWLWRSHSVSAGLIFILLSIATHAGYAIYLLKAYEVGDLSIAYPLSRSAPLLVVVWDIILLPASLSVPGIAGAVLAGLGAMTLQLPSLRRCGLRAVLSLPVTRYALLTAAFIAAFTVVDKSGVARVHPFLYLYLIMLGEAGVVALSVGRGAPARALREMRRNWRPITFTAIAGPFSYILILYALRTEPASYILGLRQSSIVFGVIFGRMFLGEGETVYRVVGAAIIALGGLMIAAGG